MTESKQPTHDVFHVKGEGENARWGYPLGAAWPHGDGQGFHITLHSVPVPWDGKLEVRVRQAKKSGSPVSEAPF